MRALLSSLLILILATQTHAQLSKAPIHTFFKADGQGVANDVYSGIQKKATNL